MLRAFTKLSIMTAKRKVVNRAVANAVDRLPKRAGRPNGAVAKSMHNASLSANIQSTTSVVSPTTLPNRKRVRVENEEPSDEEFALKVEDEVLTKELSAAEAAIARPPPVNSDYLPLPWKGRLGYVSFK
jgi:UV DNA damage endonuclease